MNRGPGHYVILLTSRMRLWDAREPCLCFVRIWFRDVYWWIVSCERQRGVLIDMAGGRVISL